MDASQRINTSIHTSLLRKKMLKGTLIACAGISILFISYLTLSENILSQWGLLIFALAILLVVIGLLPYKKLERLAQKPLHLMIEQDSITLFTQNSKRLLSIPTEEIKHMSFLKTPKVYGFGIWLKTRKEMPQAYVSHYRSPTQKYRSHLFLPYFTERGLKKLLEQKNYMPD